MPDEDKGRQQKLPAFLSGEPDPDIQAAFEIWLAGFEHPKGEKVHPKDP